ncbi:hypothetical protein HYX12_01545 [Candidatus Woesearchaeota archaeon]|nr:hypothetical protein [Candidatus Woesearchaeota archaeon]
MALTLEGIDDGFSYHLLRIPMDGGSCSARKTRIHELSSCDCEPLDVRYATTSKGDVLLLGLNQPHIYKRRRVLIDPKSLYSPDPSLGLRGTTSFSFPDADTDISGFDLEGLLSGIDVDLKCNILEERGEDAFLYAVSTVNPLHETVLFLKMGRYREERSFSEFMQTPYTPLAMCFEAGELGVKKRKVHVTHYAEDFFIHAFSYFLTEGKDREFQALVDANANIRRIDDTLTKGFTVSRFMEALCRKIDDTVSQRHFT